MSHWYSDNMIRTSALGLGLRFLCRWCLSDNRCDNVLLCAASSDTTARLWSMSTGEIIRVYQGHHKGTICCALHDGAESPPT
ncbi:hypothetical protein ZIOFF_054228 [Zingiber officinale]|uniref:Uncharacterized protein n=1 Tax=Zingiber officinale TaxID=94328 RepID=A0A8J5FFN2_ZINOF|nr:hypothetical protein ZIOFF_054228 [Zingiber officinale]